MDRHSCYGGGNSPLEHSLVIVYKALRISQEAINEDGERLVRNAGLSSLGAIIMSLSLHSVLQ